MNFCEVAEYLQKKGLTKRTSWSLEEFLFQGPGTKTVITEVTPDYHILIPFEIKHKLANGSIVQYHPTEEDLDAEDWEVTYYPPISS